MCVLYISHRLPMKALIIFDKYLVSRTFKSFSATRMVGVGSSRILHCVLSYPKFKDATIGKLQKIKLLSVNCLGRI